MNTALLCTGTLYSSPFPSPLPSPFPNPLGCLALASHAGELIGAWFVDARPACTASWNVQPGMSPVLDQAVEELAEYFAGKRTRFDVPLGHRLGSSFCHAVWEQTRAIPYGTTIAYGALGKYIAKDGKACAPRAVAAALRANPLLLFQPCHRVVYASGALSGYAAGTDRKAALLRLESGLGI